MKNINRILIVQLALILSFSAVPGWAQEDDLDLEGEIEAADTPSSSGETEEELSFEDFDENKSQKAGESSKEEMTLEPLQGEENQISDIPAKEEPPAEASPEPTTPEEFTPPPPTVAEPTPEPATPEPTRSDEPDLEFEARLHDIYLNFNSKRMTGEEWTQLLGSRDSEVYRIQRGDTLWSISKTFFNDGNYWPKIWQLNSSITNPHLIEPGNSIRFLLGTQSETPAFAVTESNEEPVEIPPGEGGAAALETEAVKKQKLVSNKDVSGAPSDEVEIPPPSEEFKPVLKRIPPSLPEWFLQRRGDAYDSSGIDYGRRPIADLPDKKYLEAFIDQESIQYDGEVAEIEGGGNTAAKFQYVFIKLPAWKGKKGDHYSVIRRIGQLQRVTPEVATSASDLGWQYQTEGQVRLDELLSTSPDGQNIFRAFVMKSLSPINKGAMVVKGNLPTLSLKSSGAKSDIMAQIVGGHNITHQMTLSLHSLAYLAGGANEGLSEGQILTVRANTRVRNEKSIIKESYIPVGLLKVVKVGARFSTAIVLKVWDAIFVGDVTGAGKVLPPEPPERKAAPQKTTASADSSDEFDDSFDESESGFEDSGADFDEVDDSNSESFEGELDEL